MKTFTVRQLDRSPAKVLAAADHDGVARVKSRSGRSYSVRPEIATRRKPDWTGFAARRHDAVRKLGMTPISKAEATGLDRLIAGE